MLFHAASFVHALPHTHPQEFLVFEPRHLQGVCMSGSTCQVTRSKAVGCATRRRCRLSPRPQCSRRGDSPQGKLPHPEARPNHLCVNPQGRPAFLPTLLLAYAWRHIAETSNYCKTRPTTRLKQALCRPTTPAGCLTHSLAWMLGGLSIGPVTST